MRVLLVNTPWAAIDVPSLALGILRHSVRDALPDAEVEVLHANLDYVDWITERFDFALADYTYYSMDTYFLGCGDWVFSSALYGDPAWHLAQFTEMYGAAMTAEEMAMNVRLHELAPQFITELAERIVAFGPDVVGFTSTFQQNAAALATAREIKRINPGILTIFGGANCDGAQGEAMHRNFPFVDFVLRGEGEASFPAFLRSLAGEQDFAAVEGLCWRPEPGVSTVNPMSTSPLPPGAILSPDFDGFFERLELSTASSWIEGRLVIESARGCWWGEKHHCTFCGLNGSFMQFRSKSPSRFHDEILAMIERHQVLDLIAVDNILDMEYLGSVLPRLIEAGYDLRVQYEVKSNLRFDQLRTLADAGVVSIQPGIESLSSSVLKLMDKGVTGCQNIRILRDAQSLDLTVLWNYLLGFPGEDPGAYEAVIAQMPALHHLEPCSGIARVAIERFSPFFNRPELGFSELRPAAQYAMIYDLPERELFDFAYLFSAPERGISTEVATRLDAGVTDWQREHPASTLAYCDLGDAVVLVSNRRHFDWRVLEVADPVELAAFRLLEQPRTVPALLRKLAEAGHPNVTAADVGALLDRWLGLGIVFQDERTFIHVVPLATNQERVRLDFSKLLAPRPATEPAALTAATA
ncbi:ribosomal peptide maturation radical SAM protein 1 [Streptomyces sp. DvalAA-14]|uniref:RiPP maturation radical SAM C-methyltransferase n=1 Tax=unclassified Streptomyces TaxID=2593676 RepID=UPI00081B5AF2|nr:MULTISPECIES: RiPP maturation radical SAM C-methyltransferase [unclassified Streptomyces]MYS18716.1 RiPP maturation radical SAM protein 1 [Streptomyces sp. SID4948]SCD28027.1 ribosomal peptide maturation radical SAM protein 1 [Streptomyces sp. DvalAA-14]